MRQNAARSTTRWVRKPCNSRHNRVTEDDPLDVFECTSKTEDYLCNTMDRTRLDAEI